MVSFVNFQEPISPLHEFSGSLLYNVTWPKWGTDCDQPLVFLFSNVTGKSKIYTKKLTWNSSLRFRLRSAYKPVLLLFPYSEKAHFDTTRLFMGDGSGNPSLANSVNLSRASFRALFPRFHDPQMFTLFLPTFIAVFLDFV